MMATSNRSATGLLLLALACPSIAAAQAAAPPAQAPAPAAADPHAAQPERPTVATHAFTVARGWVEIETGAEFDRYADKTRGVAAPTLFKIGLAPNLQLDLQAPIVRPQGLSSTGIGDLSAGIKWHVMENAFLGDLAVQPTIKFATGSSTDGMGTGTTDASLLLISSHKLGEVAMDLNVGITRRSGDGSDIPRTSTVWTASFGGSAAGNVGWCAELFGYPSTSGPAGADAIVAVLAGPTWAARDWLVFDAGVIVKLKGEQPNAIYAGMTWNVGGPRK